VSERGTSGASGTSGAAGTEGPAGHEAGPPTVDPRVPTRMFLFIGGFLLALGLLYGAASYEESGTVMLLGAAALGLWIAAYLWLQMREEAHAEEDALGPEVDAVPGGTGAVEGAGQYLPHASAWPFAIGVGAATLANGLVLGLWVIVPGAALLALGIGGFIRQTRRRD
jgi:Cytochrome c oxidase subunit IV